MQTLRHAAGTSGRIGNRLSLGIISRLRTTSPDPLLANRNRLLPVRVDDVFRPFSCGQFLRLGSLPVIEWTAGWTIAGVTGGGANVQFLAIHRVGLPEQEVHFPAPDANHSPARFAHYRAGHLGAFGH